MDLYAELGAATGFDRDAGNLEKNRLSHQVTPAVCEQVFFNRPLIAADDLRHSTHEGRYYVLGQTDTSRPFFVVFTLQGTSIRVISARDMSRIERNVFGVP